MPGLEGEDDKDEGEEEEMPDAKAESATKAAPKIEEVS